MNFNKINNIIFDLGDVIINIDFDLTFLAFEKISGKDLKNVYQQFKEKQIWEKYETGELSNSEFLDLLKSSLELNNTDDEIIDAWNALLLDIPLQRIELIKNLSQKYRLFILSNTSEYHILDVNRILQETTGISDLKNLVEKAYYSYDMGLRKPGVDIYNKVLADSGLKAEETLFLDDNHDNIIGARKMGIHSIHVTDKDICEYLKDAI